MSSTWYMSIWKKEHLKKILGVAIFFILRFLCEKKLKHLRKHLSSNHKRCTIKYNRTPLIHSLFNICNTEPVIISYCYT